jgi:hypothetical protein
MKKIEDHNVVYFSIWFIHIAKGTPQWPRFHIQCQNIQIATLIIITIHNNLDISEWLQTVCSMYSMYSMYSIYTRKLRMEWDSTTWKLICSFLVLLQTFLNPQLSGVIVTTYSGTHSNLTIERAGTEMK